MEERVSRAVEEERKKWEKELADRSGRGGLVHTPHTTTYVGDKRIAYMPLSPMSEGLLSAVLGGCAGRQPVPRRCRR